MSKYQNPIVEQKKAETIHYNSICAKFLNRQTNLFFQKSEHGQVSNGKNRV